MQNIILLHGALGASNDLQLLAQKLRDNNCHVYLFNFSGHGGEAFEAHFGIGQFAIELEHFIHIHSIHKPLLFGYSMGGYVALNLAAKKPDMMGKVMTLGTKFNWSKESVAKETYLLDPPILLEKAPSFAKTLQVKHGRNWEALLRQTANMLLQLSNKDLLAPEILKAITIPVLLGIGDRDQLVSFEETLGVREFIPKVSLCILPQTKHPIETVSIELLTVLLLDFNKKNE